jgi:hypothetical protein
VCYMKAGYTAAVCDSKLVIGGHVKHSSTAHCQSGYSLGLFDSFVWTANHTRTSNALRLHKEAT